MLSAQYATRGISVDEIIQQGHTSIVLSFASSDYFSVALLWYRHLETLGIDNHYIIQLDNGTEWNQPHGMRLILPEAVPDPGSYGGPVTFPAVKWRHRPRRTRDTEKAREEKRLFFVTMGRRMRVVIGLLERNISVLGADLDTVWAANPIPKYFSSRHDIIASHGTIFPSTAKQAWGHVMCMGFMYYRASPIVISTLRHIYTSCVPVCDDQRLLNDFILHMFNMTWARDPREKKGQHSGTGVQVLVPEPKTIRIKMVPESVIQRRPVGMANFRSGVVFHLTTTKNGTVKTTVFHEIQRRLSAVKRKRLGQPP